MAKNKSDFGEISIAPLSGQLDLRTLSGRLGTGDFRIILNASMNEMGKRCRRPQWKKLFSDAAIGFNNQDLHDQLVGPNSYTNTGLPSCVFPPNDCPCPSVPECLYIVDFTESLFDDCDAGLLSDKPSWNGVVHASGDCRWGFGYNQFSLNGNDLAVGLAIKECPYGETRWVITILAKTAGQALVIWQGEKSGSILGTYMRATGCSNLASLVIKSCSACTKPNVTIDPPDGSTVTPNTVVALHAPEGAIIYYTTDGGDPNDSSTLYDGPFELPDGVTTIKAIAYSDGCESDILEATYSINSNFLFQYLCMTGEDQAGVFYEFAPNGSPDYVWRLVFAFPEVIDITRLEIYETDTHGVWVTGQAWATDNPVYPVEEGGDPFSIYPLVIQESSTPINTQYETTLIQDVTAVQHEWRMFGQPFVPLTGYFKLIFTYVDGDGQEQKIYSLISNQCECDYGYGYGDGYDCYDGEGGEITPVSNGVINVDFNGASTKIGAAAVGQAGDYWNAFNVPLTPEAEDGALIANLLWADMSSSGVLMSATVEGSELGTLNIWDALLPTGHSDDMMAMTARTVSNTLNTGVFFGNMPRGTYDVYVYGHGMNASEVLKCFLKTPFGIPPDSLRPTQQTTVGNGWLSPVWVEHEQYVVFKDVKWMTNESPEMKILIPVNTVVYISGIQLVKKS